MKYFSHLIEIESINLELEKLDLSKQQKIYLASLIDSQLHHAILDAILSKLPDDQKRVFVQHLSEGDHAKIWKFLNEKIEKVEEKIKKVAEELKSQLHKDLKRAQK